jgi:hypothetical protein
VEFAEHDAGRAIRFPIEADAFAKTRDALTAEWGKRFHWRWRINFGNGGIETETPHGCGAGRFRAGG